MPLHPVRIILPNLVDPGQTTWSLVGVPKAFWTLGLRSLGLAMADLLETDPSARVLMTTNLVVLD